MAFDVSMACMPPSQDHDGKYHALLREKGAVEEQISDLQQQISALQRELTMVTAPRVPCLPCATDTRFFPSLFFVICIGWFHPLQARRNAARDEDKFKGDIAHLQRSLQQAEAKQEAAVRGVDEEDAMEALLEQLRGVEEELRLQRAGHEEEVAKLYRKLDAAEAAAEQHRVALHKVKASQEAMETAAKEQTQQITLLTSAKSRAERDLKEANAKLSQNFRDIAALKQQLEEVKGASLYRCEFTVC